MGKCLGSGRHHWNPFFFPIPIRPTVVDMIPLSFFLFSFADILTVPEAEIQYDNYNIIFDGEHNNLLALDTTLEERQG